MWISKARWMALEKRVADLERVVQGQRDKNEIMFEFCRSVANKEKLSLLSYQQLYSPSTDSNQKVRMLFKGEQDRVKHYLKHFGISENGPGRVTFTEIPNNENTRRVYGIERTMLGRKERKIRIVLDVDMDYPVFLLRVFPENNLQEVSC